VALLVNLVEHFSKHFNSLVVLILKKILAKELAETREMKIYHARVGKAVQMEVVVLWNR